MRNDGPENTVQSQTETPYVSRLRRYVSPANTRFRDATECATMPRRQGRAQSGSLSGNATALASRRPRGAAMTDSEEPTTLDDFRVGVREGRVLLQMAVLSDEGGVQFVKVAMTADQARIMANHLTDRAERVE